MNYQGKPIYQRVCLTRPLFSYTKVQNAIGALIRGRRLQTARALTKSKKYLNAGCGSNIKPDFINLDYHWMPGIEVCWDLRNTLPFRDASLSGIFTEHCLEHLSFTDCYRVICEFRRVLKTNGVIRIVVPDTELYLDLYQRAKSGVTVAFPYLPSPLPESQTAFMAISHNFFDHGHLYAYDAETLGKLLAKAGFQNIKREGFMRGRDNVLLIDSESRSVESLYMEACA